MANLALILGGVKSGKSTFAVRMAKELSRGSKSVVFVATAASLDREMARRIMKHRSKRPPAWQTVEEQADIRKILSLTKNAEILIIDCLTMLVSNLLLCGQKEKTIVKNIRKLLTGLKKRKSEIIIVSNEVGCGIVPEGKLARTFRDVLGEVNQVAGRFANEVYLMVAGIPVKLRDKRWKE